MTINTRMIDTLRVTPELKEIVERTAARCNLPAAEVCRRVARGIRNGRRIVTLREIPHGVTSAGEAMLRFKPGVEIPDMCPLGRFRDTLYLRCMEELAKPAAPKFTPPATEGVDYIVERCGE